MDKKAIRKKYLFVRDNLTLEERNINNKIIFEKLISNENYKNTNCIFTYVSIESEVDTISIIKYTLNEGKKIAVPKTFGQGIMKFYYINSLDELTEGNFNLLEPTNLDTEAIPDKNTIFLVPGVAFDIKKNRIGYGAGYYDCYLSNNIYLKTIALAHEAQILKSISTNEYDIKMDMIMTEKAIYI